MGKAIIIDLDFSKCNIGKITKDEGLIDANGNIIFKDASVKSICANAYGNGSDISLEEAQAVDTIKLDIFSKNTSIETFDEFKLFENVAKLEGGWNNGAFFGCINLRSINLPKSIMLIGSDAFMGCTNMRIIVDLPNLQELGFGVFHNTGITEIVNLGNIKTIPNKGSSSSHTFAGNCPNLTRVVLPSTLTSIGSAAFVNDSSLKVLVCEAITPPTLDSTALGGVTLETIQVPSQSVTAYKSADVWKNFADIIVAIGGSTEDEDSPTVPDIPDVPVTYTLTASADNGDIIATLNGNAITLPYVANEGDVILLEVAPADGYNFESWGDGNTDNPRSITMTSDITLTASCVALSSGYIQFADAEVERVLLANGVGDGVGITKEAAASVTTWNNWFANNTKITVFNEFQMFENVTLLKGGWNSGSFFGCTNLTEISLPQSITELGSCCFMNSANLVFDVDLPLLAKANSAPFHGSGIRRILNLGNMVTIPPKQSSGGHTFAGNCKNLELVIIPPTVTSIGSVAFVNDSNLRTFVCKADTPPTIAADALNNTPIASGAGSIYVPDGSVEDYKTAANWSAYADRILPLSQYNE